MRILDENNAEITSPDLSLGHLVEEEVFVAHHPAVEEVREQWHYETVYEYLNGGKDVVKVIDVPGVEAKDAWDEYETIKRYVPYTEEELAALEEARNKPTLESRVDVLETTTEEQGITIDDMILIMADFIGGE